ncbi:malto-oligosyltrehalose trehalohydrolase [Phormidium tenue FACHB-886]|nr:malto-oligosyltrehalose trehalohydrolase [Phormidium tenue FACHB-886]
MQLGSWYQGNNRCTFTVWAPLLEQVVLHIIAPKEQFIPMQRQPQGYWQVETDAAPGTLYFYQLNGEVDRPDPASQAQPEGVHGASQVVDHSFDWTDAEWKNIPLAEMVFYELHVGTFTPEGTFEAIISRLPELKELGVNAIELMPIAQFPGSRNWGYDAVYPFAAQISYGGVEGLKRLVDACHQQGMAVFLDVIYNHLGPEGNYLGSYAPYFTTKYKTPWGNALNFDSAYSYGVRDYFIKSALYWFQQCHIDGLRLDATDRIYDYGAKHFLKELAENTEQLLQQQGRKFHLVAEVDLNDPRWLRPWSAGGFGLDGQWNDDFHHAVHALLTGETFHYYRDFGSPEHMAKAYAKNYVYTWDYSEHRQHYHGEDPSDCPSSRFVVCCQNHDQVGNRLKGDRLSHLISFEGQKLAAAAVLLSASVPLLFMGEEYGETSHFLYFVSHTDPELVEAVRKGRKEEFAAFHAEGEADDPQAEGTFERSKLNWKLRHEGQHKVLWQFYQTLLRMRREIPALAHLDRHSLEATALADEKVVILRRWHENSQVLCLLNFNQQSVQPSLSLPSRPWTKILDSADVAWGGTGSTLPEAIPIEHASPTLTLNPQSVVVYHSESGH